MERGEVGILQVCFKEAEMTDQRLLNGNPKVTAIQRFDRTIILLGPAFGKRSSFDSLDELKHFVYENGYEINVSHLHACNGEGRRNQ